MYLVLSSWHVDSAESVAREAIAKRLASYANTLPGSRRVVAGDSTNETRQHGNTLLLMYTNGDRVDDLVRFLEAVSDDRVNSIVAVPITMASNTLMSWTQDRLGTEEAT